MQNTKRKSRLGFSFLCQLAQNRESSSSTMAIMISRESVQESVTPPTVPLPLQVQLVLVPPTLPQLQQQGQVPVLVPPTVPPDAQLQLQL